jgi:prevent-host-death family protein
MHQAKSQLSKLVERAIKGEEIVIARAGKPAVRLVPVNAVDQKEPQRKRPLGFLKLKDPLPDSFFFDPLSDEELDLWYK